MREQQVKKILKKHNKKWEDFLQFLRGQTVGMNEDGSANYYECDVDMFIKGKLNSFNWD